MSRKKRKIPVTPPENSELEYTLPSASMSDMTGLIPSSADDSAKRDAYDDIIPYIPRSAKNKTSWQNTAQGLILLLCGVFH